jgi:hypothetical protein
MRYLEPSIGLLAFVIFTIGCTAAPKERRGWQWKAEIFLGLSGMALFGLRLYELHSRSKGAFALFNGLLAGISIGIFVTLLLEGTLNPLRLRRRFLTARSPGTD